MSFGDDRDARSCRHFVLLARQHNELGCTTNKAVLVQTYDRSHGEGYKWLLMKSEMISQD
jgi:hypothetical protein